MKKTDNIPRVFNFSGGKTSAYMVIKYYQHGDLVIFQDTGREHPKTYKFINDFEAFENIPIIRISLNDSKNPFDEMLKKRNYKVIPNRVKRICTDELKIKTLKRYLRSLKIRKFYNYIGFRYDEPKRVKNRKQVFKNVIDVFPLYDDLITKERINHFWRTKPYTLEIPSILGNCTLCFMKGKDAILAILREYPELANDWINDEEMSEQINGKGNGRTYFKDTTIKQLRDLAQNNLFKDYPLDKIDFQYKCACTP